jgi:hypothetical protein
MSRLMSVAFTEKAVRDRTKTVTRRKGWWTDKNGRQLVKVGDRVTLCRKVMGRKKGEPLERIVDVEILSVRREPLGLVTKEGELTKEGFPDWDTPSIVGPRRFIDAYFVPQGLDFADDVTRIEWRYLDDEVTA